MRKRERKSENEKRKKENEKERKKRERKKMRKKKKRKKEREKERKKERKKGDSIDSRQQTHIAYEDASPPSSASHRSNSITNTSYQLPIINYQKPFLLVKSGTSLVQLMNICN